MSSEAAPASEDKQADLRKQLAKLLDAEPGLVPQLQALLKDVRAGGDTMTQTIGAGGRGAQVKGDGNTTTVS